MTVLEIRFNQKESGFTLIELLVVISVIGLLASVVLVALNSSRIKARDAKRKTDFHQISLALELYFNSNNGYPATGATTATDAAHTDYTSTAHPNWSYLSALVTQGFMSKVPSDPINVDLGPWPWGGSANSNTIYTYATDGTAGASDAKHYILCTWMENHSDTDILQKKDLVDPFNNANKLYANDSYSAYNYCLAQ